MKTFHVFIPLILTFLAVSELVADPACIKEGSSRSPSLKIKNKIFCNYDKDYRPIKDQKKTINVKIRLVLKYIDVMSEEDATMEIQNWLGVVWYDEFLTWNPADYDSVKSVHVTNEEIWTPDMRLFDSTKSKESLFASESAACMVFSTGRVNCVLDNEHDAHCTNNLHFWPYDTRTCELVYTTGIYNASQIKLSKDKLVVGALEPNPEWELTNVTSDISNDKKADQTYDQIKYKFLIKRHSTRITTVIILPALSLIAMTLVPLWMEPDNNERFCLIAANILSHFLFIQHIAWVAPFHGSKLPPAVTFFRDSLGLAVAVLIELTLVKALLAGRTTSPTWLLTPCKFMAGGVIGKTLLTNDVQELKDEENSMPVVVENKEAKTRKIQGERCLIVAVLDRILFYILSAVYFLLLIFLIPFN